MNRNTARHHVESTKANLEQLAGSLRSLNVADPMDLQAIVGIVREAQASTSQALIAIGRPERTDFVAGVLELAKKPMPLAVVPVQAPNVIELRPRGIG